MKPYPENLAVSGPNAMTLEAIRAHRPSRVAEFGVYRGDTSEKICELISTYDGHLDIFDFEDTLEAVSQKLRGAGYRNFTAHGNSYAYLDSYCWSIGKLMEKVSTPIWDYVFLDGAHSWAVDGFAFMLIDRLLKPGGLIDFDDYNWTIAGSAALKPENFPPTGEMYTPEQVNSRQVAMIVERLALPMGYREIRHQKIYQKPQTSHVTDQE